ncbi:Fe-S cluster assembly ATPase SufC [Lactobacillus sp.] [Lactiplantibacillus mudanjiangensis]|nr:Fe-S cluster assembly ATPase SufC [Lactobacillus sp.] [Lactiplantibacillus mudanjiangensis]
MSTLEIKDLKVTVTENEQERLILKGVNLTLKTGETHAIMGPNGTGKSTLSETIMGNPAYHICLLYTSDAADEEDSVDLGGRRIIKKKK